MTDALVSVTRKSALSMVEGTRDLPEDRRNYHGVRMRSEFEKERHF